MNAASMTMTETTTRARAGETALGNTPTALVAAAATDESSHFLSLDFDDLLWTMRSGAPQPVAGELPAGLTADLRDGLTQSCLVTGRARGLRVRCGERMVAWPGSDPVAPAFAAELLCVKYGDEAGWLVRSLWTADWVTRRIGDRHFGLSPRSARLVTSADAVLNRVSASIVDIKTEAWARCETSLGDVSSHDADAASVAAFAMDRQALFTTDGQMLRRFTLQRDRTPMTQGRCRIDSSEMLSRFLTDKHETSGDVAMYFAQPVNVRFGRPECMSGAYCGKLWSAPAAG